MANEAAHLVKAKYNQSFLETIGDEFPDWLAIVAFYKAVHLVEALFARQQVHSHSHTQRNERLKNEHAAIWKEFRPIYNASKLVRYTDRTIGLREVKEHLIRTRLGKVEALVRKSLSDSPARKKASN